MVDGASCTDRTPFEILTDVLNGPFAAPPVQVITTLPLNGAPVGVYTVSWIWVRVPLCGSAAAAASTKSATYLQKIR